MNSSNAPALLRSLVVYAICVPLAVLVGYFLASSSNSLDYSTVIFFGIVGALLVLPIFLKWHHQLLVFSWGASITVFFIPGQPNFWIVMVVTSLGISILERILSPKTHFIRARQITWPLLTLAAVALFTAELTGGIGLRAMGSSVYGGKKYVTLFLGLASYFALTSRAIPPGKRKLYVALYLLGGVTAFIGDLFPISPRWLEPIFWVFRPGMQDDNPFELGVTRLGGIGAAAIAVYMWLIARFGLRGIFMGGKLWRPVLFGLMFVATLLGGFRSSLYLELVTFCLCFLLEGLYQTWLLAPLIIVSILGATAMVPLAAHLPFTFQRALAFLPLDLSADAKASAEDSTNWRINMWTALLHEEVPQHLLLGKGYAFSAEDYNEMMNNGALAQAEGRFDAGQNGLALAGDYHNGMLSIVIPFGIWGVLAFLWYGTAGLWAVYRNMKYGDQELRTINNVLFILFLNEFIAYISCFAGLAISGDIGLMNGYLGMSVALNDGIRKPGIKTTTKPSDRLPESPLLPTPALQQ